MLSRLVALGFFLITGGVRAESSLVLECKADKGVQVLSQKSTHEVLEADDPAFKFGLVHYSRWPTEGMHWTPGLPAKSTVGEIRKAWKDRFYSRQEWPDGDTIFETNAYLFVDPKNRTVAYTMHSPNGCTSQTSVLNGLTVRCENGGAVLKFDSSTMRFQMAQTASWVAGDWDDTDIKSESNMFFGTCRSVKELSWPDSDLHTPESS